MALGAALAALGAALVLSAPAQARDGGARASIVGGSPATTVEWPWAAFILALDRREENGFVCTGTVVAPTLILTAAHCIQDVLTTRRTPPAHYAVVTGSSDIRDKTIRQVSKVSRTLVFPGFDRFKLHGDAGLLVLSTPTTAPPLALAGPTDAPLLGPGLPTSIAGWGQRGARSAKQPLVLRKAQTFVQRRAYCRNHSRLYYPFYNSSSQLCTITPPGFSTGTCHGDSGGPALGFRGDGTPVQIGITSLGPANCDARLPDIYTRVDLVAGWVAQWIAATAPPPPPVPVPVPTEG